jgi:ubiquinone/menaquinone biosynthesis C-methylase UbiE
MEQYYQGYYNQLSAALVRGALIDKEIAKHRKALFSKKLEDLLTDEISELIQLGLEKNVNLNPLRKTIEAPQVTRVMAMLRGIQPDNMLDVNNGDTVFLWRVLDEFRFLPILSACIKDDAINDIAYVHKGGLTNLKGKTATLTEFTGIPSEQFDVTTLIDILHFPLPEFDTILKEICRVTKRYIIISVLGPKKGENEKNFFSEADFRDAFKRRDIHNLYVERINGAMIIMGRK